MTYKNIFSLFNFISMGIYNKYNRSSSFWVWIYGFYTMDVRSNSLMHTSITIVIIYNLCTYLSIHLIKYVNSEVHLCILHSCYNKMLKKMFLIITPGILIIIIIWAALLLIDYLRQCTL